MDTITTATKVTDTKIVWDESTELGTVTYRADADFRFGSRASWIVAAYYTGEDGTEVQAEGCWLTHDIAERAEIEILCACQACVADATEDAYDEQDRRESRAYQDAERVLEASFDVEPGWRF